MNNVCINILKNINENCRGGYKIFSLEELSQFVPDGEPASLDDVSQAVSYLAEQKYIDIRYARGDMYCIAPLKDLGIDENDVITQVAEAAYEVDDKRLYALCAALSFAGGFLGSFIVCIIFAAVG